MPPPELGSESPIEGNACALLRVTDSPAVPGFLGPTEHVGLEDRPEPCAFVSPQDRRRVHVQRALLRERAQIGLAFGVFFGKNGLHGDSVALADQLAPAWLVHPHGQCASLAQDVALLVEGHREVWVIAAFEDHSLSERAATDW